MFLRRSLASLARAVYVHIFCRYIWGFCPPPNTKKLATLLHAAYQDRMQDFQMGEGGGVVARREQQKSVCVAHITSLKREVIYFDAFR